MSRPHSAYIQKLTTQISFKSSKRFSRRYYVTDGRTSSPHDVLFFFLVNNTYYIIYDIVNTNTVLTSACTPQKVILLGLLRIFQHLLNGPDVVGRSFLSAVREMDERFTLPRSLSAVHAYRHRQCEENRTASQSIPPAAVWALLAAIFSLIVTSRASSVVATWLRPVAVGVVRRAQLLCKTGLLVSWLGTGYVYRFYR